MCAAGSWVRDFLLGRGSIFAFQGPTSDLHDHEDGTSQDSILSPLLFNVIMKLISFQVPHGYPDDLALHCTGPAHTQRAFSPIFRPSASNLTKTKAMTFKGNAPSAPLYLLDTPLV